jgi:DNA primase
MGLSDSSKKSLATLLEELVLTDQAEEYLGSRGLGNRARSMFRLGVVPPGASAEWSRFEGMLAIPYETMSGPVAVKFRRLDKSSLHKYDGPAGQSARLFNVKATMSTGSQIVVTEGEIDAITLTAECGLPAVGVPGVSNWQPHYSRCVDGFADVIILTDNDNKREGQNPGLDLALKIRESVRNSRIVSLPPGYDVNDYFVEFGKQAVLDLVPSVTQ